MACRSGKQAPHGDFLRSLPVMRTGHSAYFIQQNLGKRCVCIDLRHRRGLELAKRLIAKADVMVENFSPGAIAHLGLGWDVVHALNPRLILCSISAFGQSGRLAQGSGAAGAVGGRWIDVALIDFYFHSHGMAVELASASGGAIRPTRNGRRHLSLAPGGIYRSREGRLVVVPVGEEMWRRSTRAMEPPDLLEDARFADNVAPVERSAGTDGRGLTRGAALRRHGARRAAAAPRALRSGARGLGCHAPSPSGRALHRA